MNVWCKISLLLLIITRQGCCQQDTDTSYVYHLPFEPGKSYLLIQGYKSMLTHRGEIALDFKMKRGTLVCAARDGTVIEIREDSKKGGPGRKYLDEGNYILVDHGDETYAWYFHLQFDGADVDVGDHITQGQRIGNSGNSGQSLFPHLHFEVTRKKPEGGYEQIPTRFETMKGVRYLKSWRRYERVK